MHWKICTECPWKSKSLADIGILGFIFSLRLLGQMSKINQVKSFIILAVICRSMWRVGGAHLCIVAPGQHSFFWKNVAAAASRWQHCVLFDRPEIWTSDLPLQRRTRYCLIWFRSNVQFWKFFCYSKNLEVIFFTIAKGQFSGLYSKIAEHFQILS